ncbi:MAG: abortive infection family protein [Myxococcales bacterium]|nr:abortive infection family protein [Myxococcales bacterium]
MTLSRRDVMRVVNQYIGVSGGYLGDFSYRTHADFYPEYCDLDIDPNTIEGTTRERFIEILSTAAPGDQAKILRGLIARFPIGGPGAPDTRTESLRDELLALAASLAGAPVVSTPSLRFDVAATSRALDDAEVLIASQGAGSALDRVHTAIHAYLREQAARANLSLEEGASITRAFKVLRQSHPKFATHAARQSDADSILKSLGSVLDKLNDLRNHASPAHPNPSLDEPEAMLAVHAARTILHYVDAKLGDGGQR